MTPPSTQLQQVTTLHLPAIAPLVAESLAEGWTFIERLAREYESGVNRFDQPGEALFVVRDGEAIVAVCGLNRDPYLDDPTVGRVRHLYVLKAHRQDGLGRLLVTTVMEAGRQAGFRRLTLRTENPLAARLYRSLGFVEEPPVPHATLWCPL